MLVSLGSKFLIVRGEILLMAGVLHYYAKVLVLGKPEACYHIFSSADIDSKIDVISQGTWIALWSERVAALVLEVGRNE